MQMTYEEALNKLHVLQNSTPKERLELKLALFYAMALGTEKSFKRDVIAGARKTLNPATFSKYFEKNNLAEFYNNMDRYFQDHGRDEFLEFYFTTKEFYDESVISLLEETSNIAYNQDDKAFCARIGEKLERACQAKDEA
jgi:hypothetical protein